MPKTPSSIVPSWLLTAKVTAPAAEVGHVPRQALLQRLDAVLERRFAALQAPAGFGKTTVLADFSRGKQAQGPVAAWISLDEGDTPSLFGSYLAYAFECAGLDLSGLSDVDAWSSSPATYRIGMVARAIELHAGPCLLVLDEVDRLPAETVELVQSLLDHGPPNLHFALAFRANPGLDLAMRVLDGSGMVVGVEDFRFSRSEIDRFFSGKLTLRRLTAIEERTAGWPLALTVHRNEQFGGPGVQGVETARVASDFVRVRLLRGLSKEDRAFVCQLAVFDWIDPEVVELCGISDQELEVLKSPKPYHPPAEPVPQPPMDTTTPRMHLPPEQYELLLGSSDEKVSEMLSETTPPVVVEERAKAVNE